MCDKSSPFSQDMKSIPPPSLDHGFNVLFLPRLSLLKFLPAPQSHILWLNKMLLSTTQFSPATPSCGPSDGNLQQQNASLCLVLLQLLDSSQLLTIHPLCPLLASLLGGPITYPPIFAPIASIYSWNAIFILIGCFLSPSLLVKS